MPVTINQPHNINTLHVSFFSIEQHIRNENGLYCPYHITVNLYTMERRTLNPYVFTMLVWRNVCETLLRVR